MVGPYGDWLNFHYEGPVRIVSETDCCRIVTPTTCEILQRVPPTTEVSIITLSVRSLTVHKRYPKAACSATIIVFKLQACCAVFLQLV